MAKRTKPEDIAKYFPIHEIWDEVTKSGTFDSNEALELVGKHYKVLVRAYNLDQNMRNGFGEHFEEIQKGINNANDELRKASEQGNLEYLLNPNNMDSGGDSICRGDSMCRKLLNFGSAVAIASLAFGAGYVVSPGQNYQSPKKKVEARTTTRKTTRKTIASKSIVDAGVSEPFPEKNISKYHQFKVNRRKKTWLWNQCKKEDLSFKRCLQTLQIQKSDGSWRNTMKRDLLHRKYRFKTN